MKNVEFLRECEQRTRAAAAGINPCADAGDKTKTALTERADQFKAAADELAAWPGIADKLIAEAQKALAVDAETISTILSKLPQ